MVVTDENPLESGAHPDPDETSETVETGEKPYSSSVEDDETSSTETSSATEDSWLNKLCEEGETESTSWTASSAEDQQKPTDGEGEIQPETVEILTETAEIEPGKLETIPEVAEIPEMGEKLEIIPEMDEKRLETIPELHEITSEPVEPSEIQPPEKLETIPETVTVEKNLDFWSKISDDIRKRKKQPKFESTEKLTKQYIRRAKSDITRRYEVREWGA